MDAGLPGFDKQELLNAVRYAEGRTIQPEVRTGSEFQNVPALLRIKPGH